MNSQAIVSKEDKIDCLVQSCSECCKEMIDGKINVNGIIHRSQYRAPWGGLDCRKCPVHLHSVETGEFARVLAEIDGEE